MDRNLLQARAPQLQRQAHRRLRRRRHDERSVHARPRRDVHHHEGRPRVVREGPRRSLAPVSPLGAQAPDAARRRAPLSAAQQLGGFVLLLHRADASRHDGRRQGDGRRDVRSRRRLVWTRQVRARRGEQGHRRSWRLVRQLREAPARTRVPRRRGGEARAQVRHLGGARDGEHQQLARGGASRLGAAGEGTPAHLRARQDAGGARLRQSCGARRPLQAARHGLFGNSLPRVREVGLQRQHPQSRLRLPPGRPSAQPLVRLHHRLLRAARPPAVQAPADHDAGLRVGRRPHGLRLAQVR